MKFIARLLIAVLALVFASCGLFTRISTDWTDLPEEYYGIPVYAQYLEGWTIALDPGHGGQAEIPGYKRGPHGVREAEMNLRVAYFLKSFLESAGAKVLLTRSDDSYISLADRAEFVNQSDADFMVSLHHNATRNKEINYTSIYYHLHPKLSPAGIDIGRNIYFALTEALHLPQVSPDGLHSDQIIYPSGFGLLRRMKKPAVLLESSFYSNFKEEERLTDESYNKREAYGIFLGLARYAAGGIPSSQLIRPANGFSVNGKPRILLRVRDGLGWREGPDKNRLRLFPDAISAKIDGQQVLHRFDYDSAQVELIPAERLTNGEHFVELNLENMFKNHNWPRSLRLVIAEPCSSIQFVNPQTVWPAGGKFFVPVTLYLTDKDSLPVWDSTSVSLTISSGYIKFYQQLPQNGRFSFDWYPGSESGAFVTATVDGVSDTLHIHRGEGKNALLQGIVRDTHNDSLLGNVVLQINGKPVSSDNFGRYMYRTKAAEKIDLAIRRDGYLPLHREISLRAGQSLRQDFTLTPVDSALFFGSSMVLDSRFDSSNDAAQLNWSVTEALNAKLKSAGAMAYRVRETDTAMTVIDRISRVNQWEADFYLRLNFRISADSARARATIYPASKRGRSVSNGLLNQLATMGLQTSIAEGTTIPEVRNTNKTAIALEVTLPGPVDAKDLAGRIYKGLRSHYRRLIYK